MGRCNFEFLLTGVYWHRSGGNDCEENSIFATEEQIQAVREQLGLDAPFHERYFDYITGVATGDLGTAITNRQPVIENIKAALPVTCTVIVMAMAWVVLFAVILSAISVIRKNGIFDNVTRIICIIGICVPSFWLALILLTAFAVNIPIFNVIADGSIKSLILPSIAMAVPIICISTRVLRASVLNELKSDYVLLPEQEDFLIHKLFSEKFCVMLCQRQSLYLPNTVPPYLEHRLWWKVCSPLMGLEFI